MSRTCVCFFLWCFSRRGLAVRGVVSSRPRGPASAACSLAAASAARRPPIPRALAASRPRRRRPAPTPSPLDVVCLLSRRGRSPRERLDLLGARRRGRARAGLRPRDHAWLRDVDATTRTTAASRKPSTRRGPYAVDATLRMLWYAIDAYESINGTPPLHRNVHIIQQIGIIFHRVARRKKDHHLFFFAVPLQERE